MENEYYKQLLKTKYNFNEYYKLTYITPKQNNLVEELLSKLRSTKFLTFEEFHTLKNIFKHYYKNFYKIKELESKQPRLIAQKFIGKKNIREFIFKRDQYKCLRCNKFDVNLTIDHISPISKGGENKLSNLQTLCKSCNSIKKDTFKDYRK